MIDRDMNFSNATLSIQDKADLDVGRHLHMTMHLHILPLFGKKVFLLACQLCDMPSMMQSSVRPQLAYIKVGTLV